VRRRSSCTEKATSLPVVGFFILKSTMGTRGTLVGSPDVERTLEPEEEEEERELAEGTAGVMVRMAELGDFTGLDAAVWAAKPEGRRRPKQRTMPESFAMRARLFIAIA
jgi:hypothetical protein